MKTITIDNESFFLVPIEDKSQPTKGYEIISFSVGSEIYYNVPPIRFDGNGEIRAVKRLGDGEVFRLGDSFCLYGGGLFFIIQSFEEQGNLIYVYQNNQVGCTPRISLNHLIKKHTQLDVELNRVDYVKYNTKSISYQELIDYVIVQFKNKTVHIHNDLLEHFKPK